MVKITNISDCGMMGQSSSSSCSEDETMNANSIPMCRYGVSCYRKNPQHLRQFRHPPKDTQNNSIATENSIPTVELHFEIGHKSIPLATTNEEGHTHEWTLFVRGCSGQRIEYFVEKVVFHVNNQFLILTEPPFSVKKVSKGTPVTVPVELNFKTEERNRIVDLSYEISFDENAPMENVRREKVVFLNASSEFRQTLINGGATATQAHSINFAANSEASTSGSNKRKRGQSTSREGDELETFGAFCANKLRNINSDFSRQKVIAQKLISEILYYAELNTLTPETRISALRKIDRASSQGTEDGGSELTTLEIKTEPSDDVVLLAGIVKTEPVEEREQEVDSSVTDIV